MAEDVTALFEQFASAYARGERPQAREYLSRAGDGADELARLVDRYLRAAPPPEPSAEAVAVVAAWAEGEPPLVHLRASRGVRVDEVVDALVADLALDPAKRPKVKGYYQRLEQGLLEPARVSERVWAVVQRLVGAAAESAAAWRAPVTPLEPLYRRATPHLVQATTATSASEAAEQADEIDALFLSGR